MPIHPTGEKLKKGSLGSPYSVKDFYAVNPAYGTEDDFKRLLAEAHKRALWIYEPEPEELLAQLIPEYVNIMVYRALLESAASEHGARMTAMRNAAENAETMIEDLTLEMNRVRQSEITQEILEVVAGAEALS